MTKIDTSPAYIPSLGMKVTHVDSPAWNEVRTSLEEADLARERRKWERSSGVRVAHELVDLIMQIGSGGLPIKLANALLGEGGMLGESNFLGTPAVNRPARGRFGGRIPNKWIELLNSNKRFQQLFSRTFELSSQQSELQSLLVEDLWIHYELFCIAIGYINREFPGLVEPTWHSSKHRRKFAQEYGTDDKLKMLVSKFNWSQSGPNIGHLLKAVRQTLLDKQTCLSGSFDGQISPLPFYD